MIEAEYTAQKIELVACCDAKETQRATNCQNQATNSATITATNSLKALAGAVLERNKQRNDYATDPEKPRNFEAANITASDEKLIKQWLAFIGEINPENIDDVLQQCQTDSTALRYFLNRAQEIPQPIAFPGRKRR